MKTKAPLLVVALAACGGASHAPVTAPTPPPPRPPVRLTLTVLSASIDGTKRDGSAWDVDGQAPAPPELGGAFSAYLAAHPELVGTSHLIGEPVDVPGVLAAAARSSAPDPMVFVEAGGKTFRTTLAPGQFQPVWRFPIVVELAPDSHDVVRLTVVDSDGPGQFDVIGQKLVPVADLFARPLIETGRFGNVAGLTLEVAAKAPEPERRRVALAARDGWIGTGVIIAAGQEVAIRAAGEVCTKGADRTRCSGPEGQPRVAETNLPGFEARGHGALVGGIGDTRFFIGRDLRFIAPSSGQLLLSVNDSDLGNNSGQLEVEVDVR
jgi:hypothetical protein